MKVVIRGRYPVNVNVSPQFKLNHETCETPDNTVNEILSSLWLATRPVHAYL